MSHASRYWFYGLPGLPLAALGLPLYIYLPTFYAEQLGIGLAAVGMALLIARVSDVLTDPLIGMLSDWLPIPSRRKWLMAIATPLLIFAIWALFLPPEGAGFWWLLSWSLLVYLAWSLLTLPYTAWGAELSGDYDQRSTITASRESFVLIGTLVAAGLPLAMGIGSDAPGEALAVLAQFLAILLPVTVLLCILKVPESNRRSNPIGFQAGLALLKQNHLFIRLLFAYFMNGIANGLPATLFLLFVSYVLVLPEQFGLLLSAYFVSGLIGLPLGIKLAQRFNKHRVWGISMLWAVVIFAWVPSLGAGDFVPFLIICILSGLSLGIDMALPASIQADVIDLDSAKGGGQRSGFFFGLWGMATKLSLALAVGIAFPLLAILGFDTQTTPADNNLLALSVLYGLLPIPFKLLAAWTIWRFPLDRQQHQALQQQIN
ncbi:MAG: MFS transporter [Piscirickettsiaceae bacterium]|jgi:glycoside/pentoside/hexuronide:cation symporter, GPH family|nr:MFS transporter [Piscirickettsiaceae bacterium]